MIEIVTGDVLAAASGFIIHGCNAQGIFGSGVARGVKARFPGAYKVYREVFERDGLRLGTNSYYKATKDLWIINAVTQDFYGADGAVYVDYDAVKACFFLANAFIAAYEVSERLPADSVPLFFPKIGAGRAGGNWDKIMTLIEDVVTPERRKVLYVVDEEPADCR